MERPRYDFELEAKRIVEALELKGATMTLTCALREAYDAGAKFNVQSICDAAVKNLIRALCWQ